MKKTIAVILIACLVVAIGAGIVLARHPHSSSANYAIPWDVIAGGGNEMASANFAIKGTTGQTSIGSGSSPTYNVGVGYWYGEGKRSYELYLPVIQ